jgi:hypothetical protein
MLEAASATVGISKKIDECRLNVHHSNDNMYIISHHRKTTLCPHQYSKRGPRGWLLNDGRLAKAILMFYLIEIDIWPDNQAVSPSRHAKAHVQTPSKHRPSGFQVAPSHGFELKHSYASEGISP